MVKRFYEWVKQHPWLMFLLCLFTAPLLIKLILFIPQIYSAFFCGAFNALGAIQCDDVAVIFKNDDSIHYSDMIRNYILALAAIIALPLAIWRSFIAVQQNKNTEHSNLLNLFGTATENMASDKMEIRVGGVLILERLLQDPNWQDDSVIIDFICAFIRNSHAEDKKKLQQALEGEDILEDIEFKKNLNNVIKTLPPTGEDIIQALKTIQKQKLDKNSYHLNQAYLVKADLKHTDLSNLNLSKIYLLGADLQFANMQKVNLSFADMQGVVLFKANLKWADLSFAEMQGANLSDTQLKGANLKYAILHGANLVGANLKGADLSDVQLKEANLKYAILHGANLIKATLQEADLMGVILKDADLTDVDFENIQHCYDLSFAVSFKDIPPINLSDKITPPKALNEEEYRNYLKERRRR